MLVLVVVTDSYMGIFLPSDLSTRLSDFINKKREFPFIEKDEIIGTYYLFGKNHKITESLDILSVHSIAKKTMERTLSNIKIFKSFQHTKINSDFIREGYIKRILQISIENKEFNYQKMDIRILRDPTILSSCFEQHIVYYKQDYFFHLMNQPLEKSVIPSNLVDKLEGRMLMVGYNVSDDQKLQYANILEPFFEWLQKID